MHKTTQCIIFRKKSKYHKATYTAMFSVWCKFPAFQKVTLCQAVCKSLCYANETILRFFSWSAMLFLTTGWASYVRVGETHVVLHWCRQRTGHTRLADLHICSHTKTTQNTLFLSPSSNPSQLFTFYKKYVILSLFLQLCFCFNLCDLLQYVATELRTELYETADIDVELEWPEAPGKETQLSLEDSCSKYLHIGLISLLRFQLLASSRWLQYLTLVSWFPMATGRNTDWRRRYWTLFYCERRRTQPTGPEQTHPARGAELRQPSPAKMAAAAAGSPQYWKVNTL